MLEYASPLMSPGAKGGSSTGPNSENNSPSKMNEDEKQSMLEKPTVYYRYPNVVEHVLDLESDDLEDEETGVLVICRFDPEMGKQAFVWRGKFSEKSEVGGGLRRRRTEPSSQDGAFRSAGAVRRAGVL